MSILDEVLYIAVPAAREAELDLRTMALTMNKRTPSADEIERVRVTAALRALAEAGFIGPVFSFLTRDKQSSA